MNTVQNPKTFSLRSLVLTFKLSFAELVLTNLFHKALKTAAQKTENKTAQVSFLPFAIHLNVDLLNYTVVYLQ